jgi:beta-galactosidase
MRNILKVSLLAIFIFFVSPMVQAQRAKHTFEFGISDFLLDKKPFQIISGEMHPARIPVEYWRHRIKMTKAMGCNTISICAFWNYHEIEKGVFDFTTGNHNLAEFIKIVQDEGMWMILIPGPYVGTDWELGGIPPYLLRIPDIRLRSMDPRYMAAAEQYIKRVSEEIKPFLVTRGGPILMLQIENEYGGYVIDKDYLVWLKKVWSVNGIDIPSFTGKSPAVNALRVETLPGSQAGIDSGTSQKDFESGSEMIPGVPGFRSETSVGGLTHWGGKWAISDTSDLLKEVKFLMDNKKSFNLYVIHGGTNFGFTPGANSESGSYEPAVTSYDYDAPVNEQGCATAKYMALRRLIGSYLTKKQKLPDIPEPIPAIEMPAIGLQPFSSVWENLPEPVSSVQVKPFEYFGQDYGYVLYRTELNNNKNGKLIVNEIHDYATVFLNGEYIGNLDRLGSKNILDIPLSNVEHPVLEILVEGMGRVSWDKNIVDRKGITDSVTLDGVSLVNWKVYNLPMDWKFIYDLRSTSIPVKKPGMIFKGNFTFLEKGDTYFDISGYTKGVVWINGHNLGRYWNIGPQKRLFCPASWIKQGMNEIIIFDMHLADPKIIFSYKTLE